jgi:hypothetical protein
MTNLRQIRKRAASGVLIILTVALVRCHSPERSRVPEASGGWGLKVSVDAGTGLPSTIISDIDGRERSWLSGQAALTIKNESNQEKESLSKATVLEKNQGFEMSAEFPQLGIALSQDIQVFKNKAVWEMSLSSEAKRTGHELEIDLPVVFPRARIFTPSQYGVIDVSAYPTFQPVAYARYAWTDGQAYVLPLVSIMDPETDSALTVALPADANIPHFQVAWSDSRMLSVRLGHRGVGGGQPTTVRLLIIIHPADYRSALRAYSEDYPAYFRPPLPRGSSEGAFWYHHIHAHPDFEEMARQHVRFVWTSFWFTHMGEFLPEPREWYPYTYAGEWKFGEKMSDETITAFIRKMRGHGIGTYAYFNVTEFGGAGGERGDSADADNLLEEHLSPALVKNAEGQIITTWAGSKVINPGQDYPYFPVLAEQARRHLERLPELEGFMVDRLDWASAFDYGHDDGLSMDGDRPMENLAAPVSDALAELCRQAHEAGKRVFVNQFWRVEVVRDADGYCHENDDLPALGYLSPFRPASAWHERQEYTGDLLPFEAQVKRRLHWALFPQFIAHEFPVCQQPPDARAADFMEIFAPLFEPLMGKEQVLLPHCVVVTGPNDVNLFRNGAGHYAAPVTSRVGFLCRRPFMTEKVELTLHVPDAAGIRWAQVYSADGPPYRATVKAGKNSAVVMMERHGTSSVVVAGKGPEPPLDDADAARLEDVRERLFPPGEKRKPANGRPEVPDIVEFALEISGAPVGASAPTTVIEVLLDGRKIGELRDGQRSFRTAWADKTLPENPPAVSLVPGDDGTWIVPERADLSVRSADGRSFGVASWESGDACSAEGLRGLRLPLTWRTDGP